MKVFLSWSGESSRKVTEILADWLPRVINSIEPWVSSEIQKGARWLTEVAEQLEGAKVGLVCLTRDNLDARWIHFESGALSKTKDVTVATFLVGIPPEDGGWPLAQFQHTIAARKDDVRQLLRDLSDAVERNGEKPPPGGTLDTDFDDHWWPQLEKKLNGIYMERDSSPVPVRTERELLVEILDRLRALEQEKSATQIHPRSGLFAQLEGPAAASADIQRLENKTEREIQRAEDRISDISSVIAYAVGALDMPDDVPTADSRLRESTEQLEQARRSSPHNRRIGIVLGRLYRRAGNLSEAIKVLSEVLHVRHQQAIPPDRDDADLYYNRGCYYDLLASTSTDESLRKHWLDAAWNDLVTSIAIWPDNRKDARADPDFRGLWDRLDALS